MGRISRNEMLMQMAEVVSQRGTCSRLQVGAVVSRDGRIIAMGYNGSPKGLPHCVHESYTTGVGRPAPAWFDKLMQADTFGEDEVPSGTTFHWDGHTTTRVIGLPGQQPTSGCTQAVHAEQNAISFAAKHGLELNRGDMHVTHAPCEACARSIINAGINTVYFMTPYRLTSGVELLHRAGLNVIDMSTWVR